VNHEVDAATEQAQHSPGQAQPKTTSYDTNQAVV